MVKLLEINHIAITFCVINFTIKSSVLIDDVVCTIQSKFGSLISVTGLLVDTSSLEVRIFLLNLLNIGHDHLGNIGILSHVDISSFGP